MVNNLACANQRIPLDFRNNDCHIDRSAGWGWTNALFRQGIVQRHALTTWMSTQSTKVESFVTLGHHVEATNRLSVG
jgi:hypothetical protein